MPITEGGTTAPVDSAALPMGALYDETNFWLFRRTLGKGWWVGAQAKRISASVTRPADTVVYAAGDAVTDSTTAPTALTFSSIAAQTGGTGLIVKALLVDSANQSTKGVFELWLFKDSPTPDNDNAPFTPTDTECEGLIGVIDFTTAKVGDATSGAGGNCVYEVQGLNLEYITDGDANIYGLVVVRNGYTPVSAEKLTFVLSVQQD